MIEQPCESIPILFRDKNLIAVNKPSGLAIHKSKLVRNTNNFLVDVLYRQLGQKVYPVHRLDRKTSGVMLLALTGETHKEISKDFANKLVRKTYIAVVRGHLKEDITIDYDLPNNSGNLRPAITKVYVLAHSEIPLADSRFPTSRYTLIKAVPLTGRMHQIRKHLAHIYHPIIGDRPHGCNKQNKLVLENLGIQRMLLHAYRLEIPGRQLDFRVLPPEEFVTGMNSLGFSGFVLTDNHLSGNFHERN